MEKTGLYIQDLKIDGRQEPIGMDDRTPAFHFTAGSTDRTGSVSAFRLTVRQGRHIVFDTDRCRYEGCNDIRYAGEALQPKTVFRARLTLWDESGIPCGPAECGFETGFLGTPWQASFIEPVQRNAAEEKELTFAEMLAPDPAYRGGDKRLEPCRQIRRTFQCSRRVRKARIYATAHGIYMLYLNGRPVSEHRLAPENSAYGKILYYQTYDITKFLRKGENVISAVLADGWWIGRLGMAGDSCNYGKRLGFLMQAEIEYTDGTGETVCSDGQFLSAPSHICYADLYIGEKQDLTKADDAWMQPGYDPDEAVWKPCRMAAGGMKNLLGQLTDGVRVTEEIPLKKTIITPKGELVLDFGQVLAGVLQIGLTAEKGDEIVFEHSETLDRDGCFLNNILGRNKDQKDVLIAKEGEQVFSPCFTYHGFRYVRITGLQKKQIRSAKALVIGTPLVKTGTFRCADPLLNQLQHCIEWSGRSNMVAIPTDCPQREKLGWTGDIQVYAKTGCFNDDLLNFLSAWLQNLRAEQYPDGEVPVVVPNPPKQSRCQRLMSGGSDSSAGWGDACVLVPWYLYECYGDRRVLEDNFNAMKKWLNYIRKNCEEKPAGYRNFTAAQKERSRYLWRNQFHFGDWLIPSLRALPDGVRRGTEETAEIVGSCFYAITVEHFIRVCDVLGKNREASAMRALLPKIRDAIREEYVAADGTIRGSSLQGLYVMVLKAGAVDGEQKQKVLEHLVRLIEENGDCLDTGFSSVSYLLDMLYENGRKDLAYRLLFQTKAPSWLYMVKNGATSIWENWLGVLEDGTPTESSYDHYAFGCVGDFIYRHIGGIMHEAPGYRKILFAPDPDCGLSGADCTLRTPFGEAELHWKKIGDRYHIRGIVPVGCEARLVMADREIKLTAGAFAADL